VRLEAPVVVAVKGAALGLATIVQSDWEVRDALKVASDFTSDWWIARIVGTCPAASQ